MHVSSIAFVSVPKPSLNYNIEKLPIIWKIHSRISQVFFSSPLQIFRHYSWQDKVIRATGNIIFFTINLCFLRLPCLNLPLLHWWSYNLLIISIWKLFGKLNIMLPEVKPAGSSFNKEVELKFWKNTSNKVWEEEKFDLLAHTWGMLIIKSDFK